MSAMGRPLFSVFTEPLGHWAPGLGAGTSHRRWLGRGDPAFAGGRLPRVPKSHLNLRPVEYSTP